MSTTKEKMFVPKDGKTTIVRFVDDPSFHHIRPHSIGGPGNVFKIPATKETEAFFEKEMAKARHNTMVMDLNFAIFQLSRGRLVVDVTGFIPRSPERAAAVRIRPPLLKFFNFSGAFV